MKGNFKYDTDPLLGSSPSRSPGIPSGWTAERDDMGRPSLGEAGSAALFLKRAFIPWVTHFQKWKMQSHAESAQHSISFDLYRNQAVFYIPFHLQGSYVMYIIFWPGGLLTFYDFFLIKVGQPENLFSLKVFFLYFSNLRPPQKIKLHSYGEKVQWVTTKKELINSKVLCC